MKVLLTELREELNRSQEKYDRLDGRWMRWRRSGTPGASPRTAGGGSDGLGRFVTEQGQGGPMKLSTKASLALWKRRLAYRQKKVDYYRGQAKTGKGAATKGVVTADEAQLIHKWEKLRDEAKAMVARREAQLERDAPGPRLQGGRVADRRHGGGRQQPRPRW
jgi:hypothetical protein